MGDSALFMAYPRLGSRLTVLLMLSAAPVFGSLGDWVLLGTGVTVPQGLAILTILFGVWLALSQGVRVPSLEAASFLPGVAWGLLAGFGQGFGTSLSRFAHAGGLEAGHLPLNGISQAFVRVVPGMMVALSVWALSSWYAAAKARRTGQVAVLPMPGPRAPLWLIGTALSGPVLGVSCFQWALISTKSAVVLAITAITPVVIIPMAAYIEKDKPGALAFVGAAIAVVGVVVMSLWFRV